jgi:hypothetical protein
MFHIYCLIISQIRYVRTERNARYEETNKCVELVVLSIGTFQILPQHVSTIHCHHQGVVLSQKLLK